MLANILEIVIEKAKLYTGNLCYIKETGTERVWAYFDFTNPSKISEFWQNLHVSHIGQATKFENKQRLAVLV